MKWEQCLLRKKVSTTTDALGNPIESFETVLSTICRFSPFDDIKYAFEGRTVTSSEQYFVIKPTSLSFTHIQWNNLDYEVIEQINLSPRWVVLRAKEYEVQN